MHIDAAYETERRIKFHYTPFGKKFPKESIQDLLFPRLLPFMNTCATPLIYRVKTITIHSVETRHTNDCRISCVVPEFLPANQDDNYTEFSFENDDRSDFLLLTKELEST
ncbi:hypothetical protein F4703DRAFT_1792816 [Phycomyces blakesleeanus]